MNNNKIYDLLKLIRLPGTFTAIADIIAGFIIANGTIQQIDDLFLLSISSSLIYSAGMVLNDYFDYSIDSIERPERPLPSGRIKKQTALYIGIASLLIGITAAFFVNISSFIISILLSCFVLAYNIYLKHHNLLSPLGIGSCRYLNLLLGMSISPLSIVVFIIPLLTGLFTCAISVISKNEVYGRNILNSVFISIGIVWTVFLLYWLMYYTDILPNKQGFILCFIGAVYSIGCITRLIFRNTPSTIQNTVKTMIFSLVILDGIIVAGTHSIFYTIIVWAMLIPVIVVSKKIYVT